MSDLHKPSLYEEVASLILDFIPFLGSGKAAIETIRGKDVITGQHLNRWLAAGGIVLGLIPFGKIFTKGRKTSEEIEKMAAKIAYGYPGGKKELLKKMENVIATADRDIDKGFIMQEIKSTVDAAKLLGRFGYKFDPLRAVHDPNLMNQYIVQMQYGGHAVLKHWVYSGKKELIQCLTEAEQKNIRSQLTDADEVFEYLKLVMTDPKTFRINLIRNNRIGFANDEKKVLIVHNPIEQGSFYAKSNPIQDLEKMYEAEKVGPKKPNS